MNGTAKTCGFGAKTDMLLSTMYMAERRKVLDLITDVFQLAFTKHWDTHPAKEVYRLGRVFDPRQAPAMEKQIQAYTQLKPLADLSAEFHEQWTAYHLHTWSGSC